MKTLTFSALADGSVHSFDPYADVLWFDTPGLSAADLQLSILGDGIRFGTPTKSFTLDGASLSTLDSANVVFADGSMLVNSSASNLYADDLSGGLGDDLLLGGAAARPIELGSQTVNGVHGNSSSFLATMNADGRYTAFISYANNLVAGDTNGRGDVFLRDNLSGTITRVSTAANGQSGNGDSSDVVLSADGHQVVFASYAGNLVAGDTNQTLDVFVKDVASGAVTRVSTSSLGAEGNDNCGGVAISADANLVAFHSVATNLVGSDGNNSFDIFVKDLATGVLVRSSVTANGVEGNAGSLNPALDSEGRHVVFESYASNLVNGDTNLNSDVFLKDLDSGAITRVSTAANGTEGNSVSAGASISADGRYVAFYSFASNLVNDDGNATYDVFVKDMQTGAVRLASSDAAGNEGNSGSYNAAISADGRYVVFQSAASNLVAGDTNGGMDVFVKDLNTGAIARLSTSAAGVQGDSESNLPSISADGSRVSFDGYANTLVGGDTGFSRDVFVTDNPLEHRVLTGGAGNDTYLISRAQDQVVEAPNSGLDTVRSSIGLVLSANVERLELLGSAAIDGRGNASANTLVGNAGDNLLDGAAGTDTASYETASSAVVVDLDVDGAQETGGGGFDTLLSIENLLGSGFDDFLFGNGGSNALDGGAGIDTLIGGAGNDVYGVDNRGDTLVEDADGGTDTVRSSVSLTLGANLEYLQLMGSVNINATGNAADNILYGNRGANVLNGGGGTDLASYLRDTRGVTVGLDKVGPQNTVGAGADTLISIENLSGSNFDDTLHGNAGSNVLYGAGGIDTLSYARAGAAISVNIALTTAQATGGGGTDTLFGFENLTGSAYADRLTGSSGANLISGGTGADTMTGAGGNDSYVVDNTLDVVVEAASGGTDTVIASVSRTLGSEQENLSLGGAADLNATGNGLANVLTGNAGANVLNGGGGTDTASYAAATAAVNVNLATGLATGGGGSDSLISIENLVGSAYGDALVGSGGANVLTGGAGADALTGGGGIDSFVFSSVLGADTVTDFASATDRLRFSQAGLHVGDGDTQVDGAVTVAGPGGFTAAAELVVVTGNIGGSLTKASAAAAIGSANTLYTVGQTALFVVDNGSDTQVYLFNSLDSNGGVSADELTLLATLSGSAQTVAADYAFLA